MMECKECSWTQFFTKSENGKKFLVCERCGAKLEKKTENKKQYKDEV